MYPAGNLFIPAPHGRLEAIVKEPRLRPARGAALVLHPHPLGGGTMHNKVVFQAAGALNDAGLVTLRCNFRGVGQSTGSHDNGRGELEDARVCLDYLENRYPGLPLTLCGFSFGAWIGLQVGTSDNRIVNLIAIGTPVDKYDFGFVASDRKPTLFVHGDQDEFGGLAKLREIIAGFTADAEVQLVVVNGADHFFVGQIDRLRETIAGWIVARLAPKTED